MTASLPNNSALNTAQQQPTEPPKGWREVQSVGWLGFGLYLFIALLTYSPLDPGWSKLSSDTLAVSNSAGVAGSWLADLFFSFLGKAAFLLPLFFVFEVLAIWRPHKIGFKFWFRWLAQALLLVAASGLFALHSVEVSDTIQNAAGGIIGLEVGQAMLQSFGLLGSTTLLGAVVLLNGSLVTAFPWFLVLEALGYAPYAAILRMKSGYQRKAEEYQEHKHQQQALKVAETKAEEKFALNITNDKVQAQIKPNERIEPSLLDIPVLEDGSVSPKIGDTPQVLDELNEALAGFTQEMPAITPEMLASAKAHLVAEVPELAVAEKVEPSISLTDIPIIEDEVVPSLAKAEVNPLEEAKLQQSQDLLAAEFGALLDDDEPVSAPVINTPVVMAKQAVVEPVVAPEPINEIETMPIVTEEPVTESIEELVAETTVVIDEPFDEVIEELPVLAEELPFVEEMIDEPIDAFEEIIPQQDMIAEPAIAAEPEVLLETFNYEENNEDDDFVALGSHEPEEVIPTFIEPVTAPTEKPRMRVMPSMQDTTATGLSDIDERIEPVVIEEIAPTLAQAIPDAALISLEQDLMDDVVFDDEEDFVEPAKPVVTPAQAINQALAAPPTGKYWQPTMDLPSLELLEKPDLNRKAGFTPEQLERLSRLLEIKLKEFNVDAKVVDALPGPVITRFEVDLAAGVKVSKITNIAKDLARSMAMVSVRVVEAILGKTVIGIEVPNENRQIVRFKEILDTPVYQEKESPITMALGKDISGLPMVADLARMPHLLVAGTTGSGKSVGVNAMILSILYKAKPEEVRLILIDPKMLELSIYDKIPHLLTPVVTDMKDAANALRWSVAEMERRYKLMAAVGVRNLAGFNTKLKEAEARGENILDPLWKKEDSGLQDAPPRLEPMPFIVIVIDEFADMMMIVGKKVEELIARIAQKARAAGIHLILATQRPSVDVITGLIKANVPSRIAFQVSSKIDSRTILDQGGAEQLLGHGDMLFQPIGSNLPVRIHGAFVSDDEVHRVCDHWRSCGEPNYVDEILEDYNDDGTPAKGATGGMGDEDADAEQDVLYDDAVAFVLETRRASISFVQRKFKIGYNRAARLIEAMEMAGLVSSMQSNGTREVLVPNNN